MLKLGIFLVFVNIYIFTANKSECAKRARVLSDLHPAEVLLPSELVSQLQLQGPS